MAKKVLILAGSPRLKGNSAALCREFAKGATEAGHEVETIRVAERKVAPCLACYHCMKSGGVCAVKDDMAEILAKILAADVLVLASPVYFYSISAQLKAVIDRCVARWQDIRNKEFYYLATSAEDSATVADCTIECFRGFAKCVDGAVERGVVCGKGVHQAGEIEGRPVLREAYEMGRGI